jgi:superfamily II DNA or RNA helicase
MANQQGRKCHMILGGTPTFIRNGIKAQIESEGGWILVATTGTMAMGVSINNLHALVTSLIGHSPHTTLQAVGRMLRKHADKMPITVCYDIYHDISMFGTNFDRTHFAERKKFYDSESYPVYNLFERNASTYK